MAFSDDEKHDIVFRLGWSGKTLLVSSNQFQSVVNDRLNNNNDQIENQARRILARLKDLDEKFECAAEQAGVKKVQDITMSDDHFSRLKKETRRLLLELSDLLDIKIVKSAFNKMVSVVV